METTKIRHMQENAWGTKNHHVLNLDLSYSFFFFLCCCCDYMHKALYITYTGYEL